MVDYRPQSTGPFDTLQAAVATESVDFGVSPETVVFMVSPTETAVIPRQLTIVGPSQLTWHVTGVADWFSVTPPQGDSSTSPQLSLVLGNIIDGWQEKTITFNAETAAETLQEDVLVRAYRGPLFQVYLPIVVSTP